MNNVPKIPLGPFVERTIDWLKEVLSGFTLAVSNGLENGIDAMVEGLLWFPPLVLILALAGIAWWVGNWKIALGALIGLLFIWNLDLWEPTVSTISLVLISTALAVLIGMPLGILGGLSEGFYRVIKPILDFMQTMPAFVYLIPAIPFFGLGAVSAVVATVIFSIPPAIRLTSLGIRQIDAELIEAADSFGSTPMQKLLKVQLPLAMPTVMAGINQTIMLALSMAVIAAMIGAGGLGGEVWRAIQRLRPGQGFEAGIAVVIVAIVLDRVTQSVAGRSRRKKNSATPPTDDDSTAS